VRHRGPGGPKGPPPPHSRARWMSSGGPRFLRRPAAGRWKKSRPWVRAGSKSGGRTGPGPGRGRFQRGPDQAGRSATAGTAPGGRHPLRRAGLNPCLWWATVLDTPGGALRLRLFANFITGQRRCSSFGGGRTLSNGDKQENPAPRGRGRRRPAPGYWRDCARSGFDTFPEQLGPLRKRAAPPHCRVAIPGDWTLVIWPIAHVVEVPVSTSECSPSPHFAFPVFFSVSLVTVV